MKWFTIILFMTAHTIDAATLRNEPKRDTNMTTKPDDIFIEDNIIYRGRKDIVDVYLPLFLLNKYENYDRIIFFVEGDKNEDGTKAHTELYVKINDTPAQKLLENCRDVEGDGLGNVYFAADDGIYIYNIIKNTADKFSSISDSFISLGPENSTGVIHALNANHVLYTITMNGANAVVNERVKGAQEIAVNIMDDNLYYYDVNKNAYVLTKDGKNIKITGIPENAAYFKMIKAPFAMQGILFMVNNDLYNAFSDGTSNKLSLTSNDNYIIINKPTAYSIESNILLYFGYEKNIYEYNLLSTIMKSVVNQITDKIRKGVEEIFKHNS